MFDPRGDGATVAVNVLAGVNVVLLLDQFLFCIVPGAAHRARLNLPVEMTQPPMNRGGVRGCSRRQLGRVWLIA